MKKLLAVVLSLVVCSGLLFTFTGCKPNSTNYADGKFNIEVAVQNENGEIKMMELWKAEYEKLNPNVNIIVKNFGNDQLVGYMQKKAMNQDSLPHLVWLPDDSGHTFTDPKNGYFIDLRQFYEQEASTDYSLYYASMLDAASPSGKFMPTTSYTGAYEGEKSDDSKYGIYFAPRDYNRIAIVINKKLFNQFKLLQGLDLKKYYDAENPEGWDMNKFAELVGAINTAIKNAGVAYGTYKAINMNFKWEAVYTTIFKALGGDGLINGEEINLGSEANRAVYDFMYDNFFNERNKFDIEDNFKQGSVFMTVVSRPLVLSYIPYMTNQDTGKVDMDFIPFPTEYIAAGCSGYGITKKHAEGTQTVNGVTKTNKELAWNFLKYIISEQGQNTGGKEGFIQPILKSLEADGAWKQAIDPALNHDAWYAGKELAQTTYSAFEPSRRKDFRTQMSNFCYNISDVENGKPENRDALIARFIDNFEKLKGGAIL